MRLKGAIVVVFLLVTLAWVVGLGCWPLVRWSPLHCWQDEIDIATGRIRHQRYLLGICISERVEDSAISRQLPPPAANSLADWKRVNTFSPLVYHSPHYIYHSAIHQSRELELLWQMSSFTSKAKSKSARDVVYLWQQGKSYTLAGRYIDALSKIALAQNGGAASIDVDQLPQPADFVDSR